MADPTDTPMPTTEAGWRERLAPERYDILRGKATERPFSGAYWDSKDEGVYRCAGCGTPLFTSDAKYDSRTGWPSFYQAIDEGAVTTERDASHGMVRTEIVCGHCGGHLGHVFDDGPAPTGLRYCVNSLSLDLDTGV